MQTIINYLYRMRFSFASLISLLGFIIIYKIMLLIHFQAHPDINVIVVILSCWANHDIYYKLLLLMNFVIKPCMIFVFTIIFLACFAKQN